nr:MucR family transcriptional regulator [Aureimonas leprariae]
MTVSPAELAARIVAAYAANNQLERAALPELITAVINGLTQAGTAKPEPVAEEPLVPAVPIKKSVTDDFIICLEDGKKFKSLKRHLMTHYGMTPDEYRAKWKLAGDYPMVAPSYAAARSALAMQIGLGRKPKAAPVEEAPPAVAEKPAPKRRAPRKAKEAA